MAPLMPTAGTNIGSIALTSFQILYCASYWAEISSPTPYSRFALPPSTKSPSSSISSRSGMLIIYTPALLVSLISFLTSPSLNGREHLSSFLLILHFGKRVLEVSFLHKYSGTMPLSIASLIATTYAITSGSVLLQQRTVAAYGGGLPVVALLGFVVGQAGNFYHHYLLASLRGSGKGVSSRYVLPSGGLFSLCVSPHYFFEVISWFSFGAVCHHLNAYLAALGMACYLAGRSVSNQRWSEDKFDGWKRKKNMIPFIF